MKSTYWDEIEAKTDQMEFENSGMAPAEYDLNQKIEKEGALGLRPELQAFLEELPTRKLQKAALAEVQMVGAKILEKMEKEIEKYGEIMHQEKGVSDVVEDLEDFVKQESAHLKNEIAMLIKTADKYESQNF